MCVTPLIRAETFQSYINKKGEKSYKCVWLSREEYDSAMQTERGKKLLQYKYRRVDVVPCGHCIECQLNYSRQWATDCMCEAFYYDKNTIWFLTLTYSDEYLPQAEYKTDDGQVHKGISLRKKDLQDFWKRVREHYNTKIKYFAAGEYGSTTSRPHYHAIVFGLPLNTEKFKYLGTGSNGDPIWTEPELEKVWGKGNIVIGQVTWQSIAYVARYTLKKAKDKENNLDKLFGRIPAFITMSQGLGMRYYQEHKRYILKTGQVILPSGIYPVSQRYLRKLREEDIESYTTYKENAKKNAEIAEKMKNDSTDSNPENRRQMEKINKESRFKSIRGL